MRKRTDSEKRYMGFRDFVDKEKCNKYDNEYFSKKRPSFKFMIPFIHKYIDIEAVKVTDKGHIDLITYFLNDYCSRESKILKGLNKLKGIPTTNNIKHLFKPSIFY
jgi:hypothetical protein